MVLGYHRPSLSHLHVALACSWTGQVNSFVCSAFVSPCLAPRAALAMQVGGGGVWGGLRSVSDGHCSCSEGRGRGPSAGQALVLVDFLCSRPGGRCLRLCRPQMACHIFLEFSSLALYKGKKYSFSTGDLTKPGCGLDAVASAGSDCLKGSVGVQWKVGSRSALCRGVEV